MKRNRKFFSIVTAIIMALTISMTSIPAFASDEYVFDRPTDATTQYDADINGVSKALYCMQYDYVWPAESLGGSDVGYGENLSKFTKATEEQMNELHLTADKRAKVVKILAAGYPNNCFGYLDPIYEYWEHEAPGQSKVAGDEAAGEITQNLIWTCMAKWGVPHNTHYGYPTFDSEDEYEAITGKIFEEIMEFVEDDSQVIPDFPTNDTFKVNGSGLFKEQADGSYMTGALSIDEPEDYRPLGYDINLPDGVYAVDEDGEMIGEFFFDENTYDWGIKTTVRFGQKFYLMTDDISNLSGDDVKLEAAANLKRPTEIEAYITDHQRWATKNDDGHFQWEPVQTMICCGIDEMNLSGSLALSAEKYGGLVVKKEIKDADSIAKAEGKNFDFNIQLSGDSLKSEYNFVKVALNEHGGILENADPEKGIVQCSENGTIEVSLNANEQIAIEGITEGVTYTVTEGQANNWTASYKNAEGAIEGDKDSIVTVSNIHEYNTVTSADIIALKDVEGSTKAIQAGQYNFVMYALDENSPMPAEATENADGRPEVLKQNEAEDNNGTAPINFGSISFNEPGTYNYVIEEFDSTVPNTARDTVEKNVKIEVNVGSDGNLEEPVVTYDDAAVAPVFTNIYTPDRVVENFVVTKAIKDNADGGNIHPVEGYSFTITPDPEGNTDEITYPSFDGGDTSETITTDGDGVARSNNLTFDEAWFENTNLANGKDQHADGSYVLNYMISESAMPADADGVSMTDDTVSAKVTVTRTTNNDGSVDLAAALTYSKQGEYDDQTEDPEFVNDYNASGDAVISVTKNFAPKDYVPAEGETYKFNLSGEGVDKEITLTADANGDFIASNNTLSYEKAGEYEYELTEINESDKHMTYDHGSWDINVDVTDNGDGTLNADVSYSKIVQTEGGLDVEVKESAEFVNTYHAKLDTELVINKTLIGADEWRDSDYFNFTVSGKYFAEANEDAPADVDQVTGSDHHVIFEHSAEVTKEKQSASVHLEMDKAGMYYIVVKEAEGTITDVIYDGRTFVVKYIVEREGNDLKIASTTTYVADSNVDEFESCDSVEFINEVDTNRGSEGDDDPTKPTDPTDPTEVTDPTDPTDPTEVTDPTDPTYPTEVTDPTDPTDPTEVTDPTDPTDDTQVTDPTDPTNNSTQGTTNNEKGKKHAKTGDNMPVLMCVILLLASLFVIAGITISRRRARKY